MTTDTPTIAQTIAGALERAAAASPEPIPVRHLIDTVASLRNNHLGSRLCGLAFHWLAKERGVTAAKLAKAFRMHHQTVSNRINSATQLKRVEPWSSIYEAIRNAPETG